ncbi:hypothetical protein BZA77DRAFT_350580 [Pyronema omphalodes]|nr:hypothetical protein BZA77DRAFT_350580 [Pyronema omphalodes]
MSQYDLSFSSASSKSSPERSTSTGFPGFQEENTFNLESFEVRANECDTTSLRQFLKREFPTLPRGYDHSEREPALFKLRAFLNRFKIQRLEAVPINTIEKQQFEAAKYHIYHAQEDLIQKLQYHIHFQQSNRGEELENDLVSELIMNMQLKMHQTTDPAQQNDIEIALAENRKHIGILCQKIHYLTKNRPAQLVLACMEKEDSCLVDLYIVHQAFLRRFGRYIEQENLRFLKGFEAAIGGRFKELERVLLLQRAVLGIQSFDAYGRVVDAYGKVVDTNDVQVDTNDRY